VRKRERAAKRLDCPAMGSFEDGVEDPEAHVGADLLGRQ